jgi:hypothetical protein
LFGSRRRRALSILAISLIVAIVLTGILATIGTQIESYEAPLQFPISDEMIELPTMRIHTSGPSYFQSVGRVYAYFSSPYASTFKTFEVRMSLDNVSWTTVPLLDSQSNELGKFADLGLVDLSGIVLEINIKCYIPAQQVHLPPNVTKEDLLNSVRGNIIIHKEMAPKDTVAVILVGATLFGTLFGIVLKVADELFPLRAQIDKTLEKPKNDLNGDDTNALSVATGHESKTTRPTDETKRKKGT